MATYRKRTSGNWQAVIRVRGYPVRSKTGFANKTQARRWAEREEIAMRTGTWTDRSRAERVTLGELLARYANEVTPNKRGHETELLRIRQFQKYPLASRIVATLRPEDISCYIAERLITCKGSTVNRELNTLHHLFVIARKRWGINMVNPCDDIERPQNPPPGARRGGSTTGCLPSRTHSLG